MKLIDKIRNIKVNSKSVIIISIIILPIIIGFGINYCIYSPSPINKYIASNLYKTPANKAFDDDNFYQCVVDNYNRIHYSSVPYTTYLSNNELKSIYNITCDDENITSIKGFEKLTGLKDISFTLPKLKSIDVSEHTALTSIGLYESQLTSLDVSANNNLERLSINHSQISSLDLSNNKKLKSLDLYANQMTKVDLSNNDMLEELYLSTGGCKLNNPDICYPSLLELNIDYNVNLRVVRISGGLFSELNVSENKKLTELSVNAELTELDVSQNKELIYLDVSSNNLTSLNLSNNTKLTYMWAHNNQFDSNLAPMLLGDTLNINDFEKMVILPDHLSASTSLSDGLEETNDGILAIKTGRQRYGNFGDGNKVIYSEIYYINVVDVKSNKYEIDKTKDYIIVSDNNDDVILSNITIENGTATIEGDNLVVKNGDNEVKKFKLIKLNSSVYDLTKDYIYVGNDNDKEIINNIDTNFEISINDNRLIIKYDPTNFVAVDLLRLNKTDGQYKIGDDYIYVLGDSNNDILSKVQLLKGNDIIENSVRIEGDKLVIKYNNITLSNLKIVKSIINKYKENKYFIYLRDDNYNDLKNNVVVDNGSFIVDEDAGHLKIMYNDIQLNSYEIIKLDVLNEAYVLGNDYIEVDNESDEEILNNIKLIRSEQDYTSGMIEIKDGYLKVFAGAMNKFDDLKIIRTSSNVYDLSKDYIYVDTASDEEIINNIETTANITINNNILNITYSTDYKISYKLIRLNKTSAQYKIGDDYIYVLNDSDEKILSKVQLLNGTDIVENSLSIGGDKLIVKYNNVVLDNLKIIRSTINKYNVNEMSNFVYLRTDDYEDLRENVIVDNGKVTVDEEVGHLKIMYNDNQLRRYEIFKLEVLNDSYILTDKYIYVGSDSYEEVQGNIKFIRSGQEYLKGIKIKGGYLELSAGAIDFEKIKIIRTSSSVYDLSKDYIYVGNDTDKEIINNIETTANITIENNILNIFYAGGYEVSYKLIRLDTKYNISKGYIYTSDENYMDNINVINGSKEIIDNNLIIKYNDLELDRISILNLYSDVYIIKGDYIYTGLSDIDLSKITTSNDLKLSKNINKVILTYKGKVIDEIPYYYLGSNSDYIRFSSKENKIYVTNKMMMYREFLSYIAFNYGNESIALYDKNGKIITNQDDEFNYLVETGSYIVVKNLSNIKYYIEVNTNKVEYTSDADVYYTNEFRKDILKNLSINSTFGNVKNLIITSGTIRNVDKDENFADDASTIKTGDKFAVVFPTGFNYNIYLSVKGDVTGKGNISNDDVLESYSILRGSKVEDYYRFASDINEDGKVKINDVAKLYQYVNNKIESLED